MGVCSPFSWPPITSALLSQIYCWSQINVLESLKNTDLNPGKIIKNLTHVLRKANLSSVFVQRDELFAAEFSSREVVDGGVVNGSSALSVRLSLLARPVGQVQCGQPQKETKNPHLEIWKNNFQNRSGFTQILYSTGVSTCVHGL